MEKELEIKASEVYGKLANGEPIYLFEYLRDMVIRIAGGKEYAKNAGEEEYQLGREGELYSRPVADALLELNIITEEEYNNY